MKKINEDLIIQKLPKRPKESHKGTFGKALIIAGSKNYPGAAILSVLAAARSGAGLITLAADEHTYKAVVPKIPFATFLDLSEVEKNLKNYDAVLIGPGLLNIQKFKLKIEDWNQINKLVLDAEALNHLSYLNDWWVILKNDILLTPHPGEMSRLTKLSMNEIKNNRKKVLLKYSKKWNKTIILKGPNTLIGNPKGEIYKSEFLNPLLATAGTGDVLSGIIVGLLAQGLNLTDASAIGVYVHGSAAELLKEKFGVIGANASDLVEKIPQVFKKLYQKSDGSLTHLRQFV